MSTFGEELKRERELRRIALREVSEATKISLRHLEALERNDFQHLPGGVFNRGFVRAYSQFIGVDPEVMVNAYLLEEKAQNVQQGVHDRQEKRSFSTPPSTGRRWGRLLAWTLVLLVLIGALIGAVWFFWLGNPAASPSSTTVVPAPRSAFAPPSGALARLSGPEQPSVHAGSPALERDREDGDA